MEQRGVVSVGRNKTLQLRQLHPVTHRRIVGMGTAVPDMRARHWVTLHHALAGVAFRAAREHCQDMAAKGFEACRSVPSFTRYAQEKHDVGLEAYVRELMGEEEYKEYKNMFSSCVHYFNVYN
jgi:hypothetical protein